MNGEVVMIENWGEAATAAAVARLRRGQDARDGDRLFGLVCKSREGIRKANELIKQCDGGVYLPIGG